MPEGPGFGEEGRLIVSAGSPAGGRPEHGNFRVCHSWVDDDPASFLRCGPLRPGPCLARAGVT
jgi:hypothetical protein